MKSYKQQLTDFVNAHQRSMYSLNTKGAKYYSASFYGRGKWDGSFDYELEEGKDRDYIIDLRTGEFIKSK